LLISEPSGRQNTQPGRLKPTIEISTFPSSRAQVIDEHNRRSGASLHCGVSAVEHAVAGEHSGWDDLVSSRD
jgi:hypothetical protein